MRRALLRLLRCSIRGCASRGKQMPQPRDVAIVLGQRAAEKVPALVIGDEIKIVGLRRARARRAAKLLRDWRWGRAAAHDASKCCTANRSRKSFGAHVFDRMARQFQRILNRGIALQRVAAIAGGCRTRRRPAGVLQRRASRAPPATPASPPGGQSLLSGDWSRAWWIERLPKRRGNSAPCAWPLVRRWCGA